MSDEIDRDFCPFCAESFASRKHPALLRAWEDFDELVALRKEIVALRQERADEKAQAAKLGAQGGRAAAAKMTPQERTERASKAARTRWHGKS
jgi:flagellar biosynthesis regulator FlbT